MNRSYTELSRLLTFEERYNYLRVNSAIGIPTFGFDRWMNQAFYTSSEWRHVREVVIARDRGFDLGLMDYPLSNRIAIHHMNPITRKQLEAGDEAVLDPEYLISVSPLTHNAIHFGKDCPNKSVHVVRSPGDTKLW